jgi:hypothetical protein
MRNKQVILFLFPIIVFTFLGIIQVSGQEKESSLKDRKVTIKRENESLATIFKDLIERYDIAVGFEESTFDSAHRNYVFEVNIPFHNKNCNAGGLLVNTKKCKPRIIEAKQNKFTINVENERLENVLDLIVEKMQYYKWEINDDVVNIFPAVGRDKRFELLLNTKIKNFTVQRIRAAKKKTIYDLRDSIASIPEFREFLKNNSLYYSSQRYNSPNLERELPAEEITFSDLTLKELLNKITKIKRGGWALRQNKLMNDSRGMIVDIDI